MKFDDILLQIGEFGPYQRKVYFLLCLPALLCGTQVMSIIFTMATPMYRCQIPGYPNDTYHVIGDKHAELINLTIPPGDDQSEGHYSECFIFSDVNITNLPHDSNFSVDGQNGTHERPRHQCSSWVYDQTEYQSTAVSEFDMVCEDAILRSHSNMVQFAGSLFGCIFMGVIADGIGRKKAIMLSLVIQGLTALAIYLAPSYGVMVVFRGIAGIASYSLYSISASMGIELVGPSKRTLTGVVVNIYWAAGVLLVLPIAYLIRDWRNIQLVLSLLTVPLFSLWWLIPESPRWLLDKNRFAEAESILETICLSNNTKLPPGAVNDKTVSEGPKARARDILTHPVFLVRTLIIFLNWLSVNFLYYGLSLNLENLAGSTYLNFLFGVLVEIIAYIACLVLMDRLGRRKLHCLGMFCGGIACLAVILPITLDTQERHTWVTTLLAMIGKLCASGCYAILYIMSAELFPTVIRNFAIGCCSIFESVGAMVAPYIADLSLMIGGPFSQGLPMLVFGGISIVAGSLSLLLPETLNQPLPETFQDVLNMKRTKKNDPRVAADVSAPGLLMQEAQLPLMPLKASSL